MYRNVTAYVLLTRLNMIVISLEGPRCFICFPHETSLDLPVLGRTSWHTSCVEMLKQGYRLLRRLPERCLTDLSCTPCHAYSLVGAGIPCSTVQTLTWLMPPFFQPPQLTHDEKQQLKEAMVRVMAMGTRDIGLEANFIKIKAIIGIAVDPPLGNSALCSGVGRIGCRRVVPFCRV